MRVSEGDRRAAARKTEKRAISGTAGETGVIHGLTCFFAPDML